MNFFRKPFYFFLSAALLSLAVFYRFTYPQFAFINLTHGKNEAIRTAENYLRKDLSVDPSKFRHAVIFSGDIMADRYLQKALGYEGSVKFLSDHQFEYFFWKVRFFIENEVEEYQISVSAATGEVTNFRHVIPEGEGRPAISEQAAKENAVAFLHKRFGFNPVEYTLESNLEKKFDNRTEYTFVWERNDVYVPWSAEADSGGAKLKTSIRISGDEVLVFNKKTLDIPEKFSLYFKRLQTTGQNLALIFRIVFFTLLATSVFYVVVRRNNLVMHTTKNFCLGITLFIFILNILVYFNEFQSVLFQYKTTSPLGSYIWRSIIQFLMDTFIVTISILTPCLAGESLHYEVFRKRKEGRFLHYILSSTRTRAFCRAVLLGYAVCVIMIGIQTLAFEFGQRFLSVWVEYVWMTQLSSSYIPFLAIFCAGAIASASEEICFRLFSISLGCRIFKSTVMAVLTAAIFWGYGHSTYLVFPMWFRGLEVTCLGIFLGLVYLRHGIIPVLVAHYLFDVFWSGSAYLLGKSDPHYFYGTLAVLLLPLMYAAYAYVRNLPDTERGMFWRFNKHQLFNLNVLKFYLQGHRSDLGQPLSVIRDEIHNHGWDSCVVEKALQDITGKPITDGDS